MMEDSENEEINNLYVERPINNAPKDRYYSVYAIFFLLGVGSLLPWNFFSNAKQYFTYKLRNTSIDNAASWQNTSLFTQTQILFENYLEIAALVPSVLFMFINMAASKTIDVHKRLVCAIITILVLFILTIVLTWVSSDQWQTVFLGVSLTTIVFMNAGSAVLQGGACGLASLFPKAYMQGLMSGMGMGGLLASIASIVTIWLGSEPIRSGFGYFLIAECVTLAALVGYLILPRLEFARVHMENLGESFVAVNSNAALPDEEIHLLPSQILPMSTIQALIHVFKQIWVPGFCVFFVYFITLSCYPAVNSMIQSVNEDSLWTTTYFIPVTCFLLYNLTDFTGRTLAGIVQWPTEGSLLLPVLCLSRVVFVPVFLLCNIQPHATSFDVLFNHDAVPIMAMCFFGLTNGHLGTLSMMYAPRSVSSVNVELAGSMMSFFLGLGLGVGALFSMLIVKLIKL